MKRALVILGAVLLIAGFYFLPYDSDSNEARLTVDFKTVETLKGELIVKISAKGVVEPNFQVEVKSKASGEVLKFAFEEGDTIKKGQALLHLDKSDETRNVAKAEADVMSGHASLKKAKTALLLQKTRFKTDLQSARSEVGEAEANLKEAEDKRNRQADLFQQKFASKEVLDTAETNFTVNREILVQARARLQAAKEAVYDIAMKEHEIELARAEVQRRQIALDEVNERLEETDIFSPISGVIIEKLVEEGQIISSGISNVSGGTALAVIADMSRLFIIADVDETDIGVVQVGQEVEVTADAFYGKTFSARVLRVAPKGLVENSITIFKVKIEIVGTGKEILKPMMTANVDIISDRVADAIYVAREAVRRDGERTYAVVLNSDVPGEVPIAVGVQTPIYVQILSGLQPGQKVLVGDWEKVLAEAEKSGKKGSTLRKILWMIRSK
ncbi:MAG: efflux RND transporter periplasmic adaptor subunit [Nitrospinae bacterium]|nr:efflux RND transporter periplasmic adaptor subunit [Nitrospinota bacterium]